MYAPGFYVGRGKEMGGGSEKGENDGEREECIWEDEKWGGVHCLV